MSFTIETTPVAVPPETISLPKSLDVDKIRQDFPFLKNRVNGHSIRYLDNAATTQKPQQVLDKLNEYYRNYNANVHRAIYTTGEKATHEFEESRSKVANFINAPNPKNIIFTRGTTEAINLVAYAWGRHNLKPGDEILITEMEHHSNIVPWQLAARDTGATLKYIPIHTDGTLALNQLDDLLTEKTKLVGVIYQSNVFGTVNPIEKIVEAARSVGAVTLVDAAQSIPHGPVDVQKLNCDFLAFSGHKMLGPSGVGILYGKEELLETMEPFLGGGEMISTVTMEESTWNDIPWKFEAGTPNIAQAIGLGAAVDYLSSLGMEAVKEYEQMLTQYALNKFNNILGMTVYGNAPERGGVISFNVDGIHPHDMAQILDQSGIAVRAGHHCAQPIMKKLEVSATTRASFYIYNTTEEIDHLVNCILKAKEFMTNE